MAGKVKNEGGYVRSDADDDDYWATSEAYEDAVSFDTSGCVAVLEAGLGAAEQACSLCVGATGCLGRCLEPAGTVEPLPVTIKVPNPGAAWIRDAKDASGKVPMYEILAGFAPALALVAQVSAYGYHKHTAKAREKLVEEEGATEAQAAAAIPYNNWLNGTVVTYDNAQMRHVLDRMKGYHFAEDSKMLHRAHECWNALAALTLYIQEENIDVL